MTKAIPNLISLSTLNLKDLEAKLTADETDNRKAYLRNRRAYVKLLQGLFNMHRCEFFVLDKSFTDLFKFLADRYNILNTDVVPVELNILRSTQTFFGLQPKWWDI